MKTLIPEIQPTAKNDVTEEVFANFSCKTFFKTLLVSSRASRAADLFQKCCPSRSPP